MLKSDHMIQLKETTPQDKEMLPPETDSDDFDFVEPKMMEIDHNENPESGSSSSSSEGSRSSSEKDDRESFSFVK